MRQLPIRIRLTAWYALVLTVVLTALGVFVVTRLRADLTAEVDRNLLAAADQIATSYRTEGPAEFTEAAKEFLAGGDARASGAQVLDGSGAVVTSTGDRALETPLLDPARVAGVLATGRRVDSFRHGPGRTHLRAVAIPVQGSGRQSVVISADSLHDVDAAVARVTLLITTGGLAALVLACLGGWWIARKGLRPVAQMTVRAEEIDVGDLSQRVPVPHANDELQHLARTLNAMLGRLEHGVAAREQLVADASHELRGPLAAMRAELEVSLHNDDLGEAGRAVVASAREEVVRMGRIVENLLTLARVDDGHLDLLLAPHDLNEIAARGARPYAAAAAAAGLTLTIRGEPLLVTGDGDRLEQVVGNLVDNAVRVGPPGSAVVVTTAMRGHAAVLTVSDAGPGVPDEARTRIFERFGRADSARTRPGGAGLGLAICREIVSAHGGDIRVDPNEHGGATFVVTLRAIEDGAARLAPPPYDEHAQLEPA